MAKQLHAPINEAIEIIELSSGAERLPLTAADRNRLSDIRTRRIKLAASQDRGKDKHERSPSRRGYFLAATGVFLAILLALL